MFWSGPVCGLKIQILKKVRRSHKIQETSLLTIGQSWNNSPTVGLWRWDLKQLTEQGSVTQKPKERAAKAMGSGARWAQVLTKSLGLQQPHLQNANGFSVWQAIVSAEPVTAPWGTWFHCSNPDKNADGCLLEVWSVFVPCFSLVIQFSKPSLGRLGERWCGEAHVLDAWWEKVPA